jgi:hypothetical protein
MNLPIASTTLAVEGIIGELLNDLITPFSRVTDENSTADSSCIGKILAFSMTIV